MYKRLLCAFVLLILFSAPVNASAENEVSFHLTDASCDKNRLFETTLCVSGEVAAFTAELNFDENAVEFREAKALTEDAELSVNSNEIGKIKIAYLCESGTAGELITFTFKSTDKSTDINLNVEQVIDSDSNDLSVTSLKGATITVEAKKPNNNNKSDKADSTEGSESSSPSTHSFDSTKDSVAYLEIPPENAVDTTLIFCIAGGTALMFAVAAVAFFLGKKASAKNK